MRFNLEPGDDLLNNRHSVAVRISDTEKINLPFNYYGYTTSSFIHNSCGSGCFSLYSLKCDKKAILDDLYQALIIRSHGKLILVHNSYRPYYYYKIGNNIHMVQFDYIPEESQNNGRVLTFDFTSCFKKFMPFKDGWVSIDPKDIISSKNITAILKDPNIALKIQNKGGFSEVYNSPDNKIGTLNNVVPYFKQKNYPYRQVSLFPYSESFENSYFTAKKLGRNYVGCISDENGECRRFYELNPDYFGYEHDSSSGPYPYYYNLENFDNFLEVDMKTREYIDIERIERKVKALEDKIQELERAGVQGPPGPKGEPGYSSSTPIGRPGPPGPRGYPISVESIRNGII